MNGSADPIKVDKKKHDAFASTSSEDAEAQPVQAENKKPFGEGAPVKTLVQNASQNEPLKRNRPNDNHSPSSSHDIEVNI